MSRLTYKCKCGERVTAEFTKDAKECNCPGCNKKIYRIYHPFREGYIYTDNENYKISEDED